MAAIRNITITQVPAHYSAGAACLIPAYWTALVQGIRIIQANPEDVARAACDELGAPVRCRKLGIEAR